LRRVCVHTTWGACFQKKVCQIIASRKVAFSTDGIALTRGASSKALPTKIYMTGNTVIDAQNGRTAAVTMQRARGGHMLVTAHRRKSKAMAKAEICQPPSRKSPGINLIYKFFFPVH
jgi:hypothetical protein